MSRHAHTAARGAASLIVVLLLFLVLSLTAAYTSRNLVFEQKTSANQARATAAFEAAEAGVEWALTQLNGSRVNGACEETTVAGQGSFQQRYLAIAADGNINQSIRALSSLSPRVWPTCVYNGTDWTCACPANGDVDPVAPVGAGFFPAFRVWPAVGEALAPADSPWTLAPAPRAGVMRLTVAGCTRLPGNSGSDTCLNYFARGDIGEGLSGVRTMVAFRSGLSFPPAAAITARLQVQPYPPGLPTGSEPKLLVTNTDQRSKGYTVNTAQAIDASRFVATTIPGTPGEFSFVPGDPKLIKTSIEAPTGSSTYGPELTGGQRMFVLTFGMKRQTYREQPGLRVCDAPCTSAKINTLLADHPHRIIWVDGNLTLDADIGDGTTVPPLPVLLIVDGEVLTLGNDVDIFGFVYLTGRGTNTSTIALPDTPTSITGALVAEGNLLTSYSGTPAAGSTLSVVYAPAALELLRTTYGSWVRLPGSWRDFKVPPP